MKNYRRYNFQASANISGNFWKISGNIKFPKNLQPCCAAERLVRRGVVHKLCNAKIGFLSPSPHHITSCNIGRDP